MTRKSKHSKIIFVWLLSFAIMLSTAAGLAANFPKLSSNHYVTDAADVIGEDIEKKIAEKGKSLWDDTAYDVVVVTVNFTDELETSQYATKLINQWEIGDTEHNLGLLLLLSIIDDDYHIVQTLGSESIISPAELKEILNTSLEPDFAAKDYEQGVLKTYEALDKVLRERTKILSPSELKANTQIISKSAVNEGHLSQYISDHEGLLSKKTIQYITDKNNDRKTEQTHIYVQTIKGEEGLDLEEAAKASFKENDLYKSDILLLVSIENGAFAYQGDGIESVITESVLTSVLDEELFDDYEKGNYDEGIYNTAKRLFSLTKKINLGYVSQGTVGTPPTTSEEKGMFGFGTIIFIILLILFVSALTSGRRNRRRTFGSPYMPPPRRTVFFPFFGGWNRRPHRRNPPPPPGSRNSGGMPPFGSGGSSFFGGSSGSSGSSRSSGGGFSRGGRGFTSGGSSRSSGAGRSSGSGGRSSGGGFSRGSGAGRK